MTRYAPANDLGEKPYVVEQSDWGRKRTKVVYASTAAQAKYRAFGRRGGGWPEHHGVPSGDPRGHGGRAMTAEEYTPSVEEARAAWVSHKRQTASIYGRVYDDDQDYAAEFDRMIAAVRAEALRESTRTAPGHDEEPEWEYLNPGTGEVTRDRYSIDAAPSDVVRRRRAGQWQKFLIEEEAGR